MGGRLLGVDLARLLALVGMVLVHGWTDLVLLPLEEAGAAIPDGPEGPGWAVALQSIATDRARPLFVLLAGLGVTLVVSRTGAGPRVLLLRAVFLAATGAGLLVYGWSDVVLVAYGILFVLAVALVRMPSAAVLVLAAVFWSTPVAIARVDGAALDGGPIPALAEFGYFFVGVVIGRLDLTRRRVVNALTASALATAGVGAIGLVAVGASPAGWQERTSWAELGFETLLTVGGVVGVLGMCLMLGSAVAGGPPAVLAATKVLATAGSMPLTIYVAHALLYPALVPGREFDLVTATQVGAAFLALAVVAANVWAGAGARGTRRPGPVESLMRRVSGPASRSRPPAGR